MVVRDCTGKTLAKVVEFEQPVKKGDLVQAGERNYQVIEIRHAVKSTGGVAETIVVCLPTV
jgi:hypothetical protein